MTSALAKGFAAFRTGCTLIRSMPLCRSLPRTQAALFQRDSEILEILLNPGGRDLERPTLNFRFYPGELLL